MPETPPPAAPTPDPAPQAVADPEPQPPAAPEPVAAETPEAQIARLENDLRAARAEAGKTRVNAKAAAADEARSELAQQIGRALGLVKDEPVDPVKLTEQALAAAAQARQAQVELAVFRAAQTTGADPVALLDSRAFLTSLTDVEPGDVTAINAAITAALSSNPRLGKADPTPPQGGGMKRNPAQGGSASPPLGLAEQIAAATQAGDTRAAIRLKAAMALNTNNP